MEFRNGKVFPPECEEWKENVTYMPIFADEGKLLFCLFNSLGIGFFLEKLNFLFK